MVIQSKKNYHKKHKNMLEKLNNQEKLIITKNFILKEEIILIMTLVNTDH